MTNEMELSFNACLANEPFARTCVASFLTSLNPNIDEIVEIKTIVSEAVSNAIIHGYNHHSENKVVVKVSILENRYIEIIVQDYGQGIDNIEEARQPMFSSKKELEHAGMGLTIIEAFSDCLEIMSTVNLGTKLIIKKRLKD